MRSLKAVVIAAKKFGVEIRLESGQVTTILTDKQHHIGQSLLVSYDFTKKEVLGIIDQYYAEDMLNAPKMKAMGDDNDPEDPEILDILSM